MQEFRKYDFFINNLKGFPGSQMIKNLPAMQETWVHSLGWDNHLEKAMATHSQCSRLGNPMDRGNWWAIPHGVTKSWI